MHKIGTSPTINPINANFVGVGKVVNRNFRTFPKAIIPTKLPDAIGNKNLKLFLSGKGIKILKLQCLFQEVLRQRLLKYQYKNLKCNS